MKSNEKAVYQPFIACTIYQLGVTSLKPSFTTTNHLTLTSSPQHPPHFFIKQLHQHLTTSPHPKNSHPSQPSQPPASICPKPYPRRQSPSHKTTLPSLPGNKFLSLNSQPRPATAAQSPSRARRAAKIGRGRPRKSARPDCRRDPPGKH